MSRREYVTQMLDILRTRVEITSDPVVKLHAEMQIHLLEQEQELTKFAIQQSDK